MFLISTLPGYAFQVLTVQGQVAAHIPENILDRVQELGDISSKEAADGTDPEGVDTSQPARMNNHSTVTLYFPRFASSNPLTRLG